MDAAPWQSPLAAMARTIFPGSGPAVKDTPYMLGLDEITAVIGAAAEASTPEGLTSYAVQAAKSAGLHIMLCQPGGKEPWDTRTPATRKQDAALWETLDPDMRPSTPEGMRGLHIATDNTPRLRALLRAAYKQRPGELPNLAINVGRSRLLVVDVDTPEEVQAFRDWASMRSASGEEAAMWQRLVPTVTSPGTKDAQGNWVHHGGGHFWLRLSDDDVANIAFSDLPADMTIHHGDSKFSLFITNHYVLIPPSRRAEGAYRSTGPVVEVPPWMIEFLADTATQRRALAARDGSSDLSDEAQESLQDWYDATPWSTLLDDLNYTVTGTDSCGCPIWGRPGGASRKSVTAHQRGCTSQLYGGSEDPPLVIWTDNPGPELEAARAMTRSGGRAVSKAQVASAMYFDGDMGRTFTAIVGDNLPWTTGPQVYFPGGVTAIGSEEIEYTGSLDEPVASPPMRTAPVERAQPSLTAAPEQSAGTSKWEPIASPAPVSPAETYDPPISAHGEGYPQPGGFNPYTAPYGQAGEQQYTGQAAPHVNHNREWSTPGSDSAGDAGSDEESMGSLASSFAQDPLYDTGWKKYEVDEVRTAPNIVDLEDIENTPRDIFLVDELLQRHGRCAIVGASNVGKSALLVDMLCALAADPMTPGANFNLWHGRRVMPSRVLYVAGEGARGAVDRVSTWKREYGRTIRKERFKLIPSAVNFGATPHAWYDLEKKARAYFEAQYADPGANLGEGNGVLVFDTLATMLTGVEENSATDMGAVMNRLETLRDALNCTIILVHHTGKGENADVMRGSSAITGALDSVLMLTPVDMDKLKYTDPETFDIFESGDNRTNREHTPIRLINVRVEKQRNFRYADDFPMSLVAAPVRNPDGSFARSQWTMPGDESPTVAPPTAVIIGDRKGVVPVPSNDVVSLDTVADYRPFEYKPAKPDLHEMARDIITRVTYLTTVPAGSTAHMPLETSRADVRSYISGRRGRYHISSSAKETTVKGLFTEACQLAIDAGVLNASGSSMSVPVHQQRRRDRDAAIADMLAKFDAFYGGQDDADEQTAPAQEQAPSKA